MDSLTFVNKSMTKIINILETNLSIASFAITKSDMYYFAEDIYNRYLTYDIGRYLTDPAIKVAECQENSSKDPTENMIDYAHCYNGLNAIIYYRIAHKLLTDQTWISDDTELQNDVDDEWKQSDDEKDSRIQFFIELSKRLSEQASHETGIEINPKAKIEKGFVIDHVMRVKIGVDIESSEDNSCILQDRTSVIGETCEIGQNCTILNDVILGAYNLRDNPSGKRHPTIGDNVILAAGVRVFGNVRIGNNVFVSPYCIITNDIPDDTNVLLVNQLQLNSKKENNDSIKIYGLVPVTKDVYSLLGKNLGGKNIKMIDEKYEELKYCEIIILNQDNDKITFKVTFTENVSSKRIDLMVYNDYTSVYYINSNIIKKS